MLMQPRAKRPWLLLWALSWLCCVVSLDLLHNANHGVLESATHHHACVICQYGNQPSQAATVVQALPQVPRAYVQFVFGDTGTTNLPCTSPQPRVPRGPPFPFLVTS